MSIKVNFKKDILPHLAVIAFFVIASVLYFSPLISGDKLYQGDIANYKGMSKEITDFRQEFDQEPYWTNSMFSGMPAYQISVLYQYDWVKSLDRVLKFLPHPASTLFLYFISFYFMMVLLGNNWRYALLGALAFGFSTYFLIIIEAGHNAKAHAIAYFPLITAGILLVLRNKLLLGGIITALFMALEISVNHFQMTYYLGLSLLIYYLIKLYQAIVDKKYKDILLQSSVLLIAIVIAFGANASKLMSTYEYTKYSTRGPSELTSLKSEQNSTKGLDRDYITQWSYGVAESFNLLVPRFMGGASGEELPLDSNLGAALSSKVPNNQLQQILKSSPTYWGEQPFVSGPAYIGAVIVFLFVLGLFILKGELKWWLLASTILSLVLSWGKNFMPATDFMLDYFPFYDKFRAVSSIQVIAEFAVPLMAVLTLKEILSGSLPKDKIIKSLKNSVYIIGGLLLAFIIFGPYIFDFQGLNDEYYSQMGFPMDQIVNDRIDLLRKDSFRSLMLILLTSALIFFVVKGKVKHNYSLIAIGLLIVFDLVQIDKKYLNNDNFVDSRKVEYPFTPSEVDKQILRDKGNYRVYNASVSTMSDASTSYFHKSIGGYHGAKLKRYQELWDYQIQKGNFQVLNMLNTKYFIFQGKDGQPTLSVNDEANGNAWFVDSLIVADNADMELELLSDFNSKTSAVIDSRFLNENIKTIYNKDSISSITLKSYKANQLEYVSANANPSLAVFSEIYYPKGWKAYVDGVETEILRVNYVLRALALDSGEHSIVFKFEPEVIEKSNKIVLAFNIVLFGSVFAYMIFSIFGLYKKD